MKHNAIQTYGRLAAAILLGLGLILGLSSFVIAQNKIFVNQFEKPATETAVSGTIYHVAKNGTATDGLTWATAYTDLQDALAIANAGDEIWVASGVYTPGILQTDTFHLVPGVAMYGGFIGTETEHTQRNWETNFTVLSGDIDNDDIVDANGVVTSTQFLDPDNTSPIVTALSITETNQTYTESTVLDGFTITAGYGQSGGGFHCRGAGINRQCSPYLRNIHFSGNYAEYGGAMYISAYHGGISSPILENVTFTGNEGRDGGAIANSGSPTFNNVTFTKNIGTFGGAIFNQSWGAGVIMTPTYNNVTFTNNSASSTGGAINNWSYVDSIISTTLNDVTFSHNSATWWGGAIYGRGQQGGNYSAILNNVRFYGNTAGYGGGLYNASIGTYWDEETGRGGTVNSILNNVIFAGNSASYEGGAVGMSSSGEKINHTNLTINNATFANNSAIIGGALGIWNYSAHEDNTVTVNNSIFWGNTDAMHIISSTLTTTTNLIQGGINGPDVFKENATINDGGGNLSDDPLIIRSPDSGDGDWTTAADNDYGDLRLSLGSPAIDTGTNSAVNTLTDADGHDRIINGTVDMGAYENWLISLTFKTFLPQIMR